jgi:hypothetical protein
MYMQAVQALPGWARTHGVAMRRQWRRRTSSVRVLPDFLIIGAQKGGTSSLYNYLTAHPAVIRAATKEVHYFDLNYARGVGWYRSHFPTRRRLAQVGESAGVAAQTGEASPYYLFHPQVPERVFALLPDVRLIVLLRDPVERALSHHNHARADGYETLGVADAFAAEPRRLAGEAERLAGRDPGAVGFCHQHHSYLSRGRYAEQLERWFALFPRDQLMIADSRELFEDAAGLTSRAFAFLGLPEHALPRYDVAGARPHTDVDPELRARLCAYFDPHNHHLYELLEEDFGWQTASSRV